MNRTTENFLVYGSLGAALALALSGRWRLGLLTAAVAPATYASQHPRESWKIVRRAPQAVAAAGKFAGKAVGEAGEYVGKSLKWAWA